ncbi:MAG: cbb3-type cytochrome c oxidase subunit I, partial [Pseudomonadota bacterium]
QIGTRDVSFPFMNSVGLWLTGAGAGLMLISLVVGEFSTAGWTGYPPYSGLEYSPGVGVDYWIWSIFISGLGSTLTGINFIVTILKRRAPGMTLMRMPLFTWTVLISSILIAFAFPALTVATGLLALDRYADMHFFTNASGGNMMNFINLLWIWGHPEVYILILPAFGIFSEVVATFCRKKLFGYESLVYATAVIGLLSFTVWLHHFFTMGAGANVNAIFGIATMIIAVPTGVKVFDWLFTMYRGRITFSPEMHWTIGFIVTFVIGGVTGVLLAIPPVDYIMHNTVFLVAHFHNMIIPGVLFGYVAGMNYWFPKAFGFELNAKWGIRAFWGWLIGFCMAFMPLYLLGLMGMPRRMETYDVAEWQPLLMFAAMGAVVVLIGIICMVIQLLVSIRDREKTRDLRGDPWNGRTLEWLTSSPAAAYNFAVIPKVEGRDAFWKMKEDGTAYRPPQQYSDIAMPKNSGIGVVVGGGGFVFGFAMIWYIWWLAILSLVVMGAALIVRSSMDHTEEIIPAAEVEAIEKKRLADVASLPAHDVSELGDGSQPVPVGSAAS